MTTLNNTTLSDRTVLGRASATLAPSMLGLSGMASAGEPASQHLSPSELWHQWRLIQARRQVALLEAQDDDSAVERATDTFDPQLRAVEAQMMIAEPKDAHDVVALARMVAGIFDDYELAIAYPHLDHATALLGRLPSEIFRLERQLEGSKPAA